MPIKFKVVEKGQPGVVGGGEKKFYASMVNSGEMSLEQLTTAIEKISTVSGADIRAVLYAMVDVAVENLSNGQIVRFGDLGSFRMTLSSEGRSTEPEVNAGTIKKASVIFTPGTRIKSMLAGVKFQKA